MQRNIMHVRKPTTPPTTTFIAFNSKKSGQAPAAQYYI